MSVLLQPCNAVQLCPHNSTLLCCCPLTDSYCCMAALLKLCINAHLSPKKYAVMCSLSQLHTAASLFTIPHTCRSFRYILPTIPYSCTFIFSLNFFFAFFLTLLCLSYPIHCTADFPTVWSWLPHGKRTWRRSWSPCSSILRAKLSKHPQAKALPI